MLVCAYVRKGKKKCYLLGSTNASFRVPYPCCTGVVPVLYLCHTGVVPVMSYYTSSKKIARIAVLYSYLYPCPCFLGYLFCKLLCLHNGHMACIQMPSFMRPCYHFWSMKLGSLVQLIKKDRKNSC